MLVNGAKLRMLINTKTDVLPLSGGSDGVTCQRLLLLTVVKFYHCLRFVFFILSDRQVLDSRYGLKRWQIGEVASKIGQLYYHY